MPEIVDSGVAGNDSATAVEDVSPEVLSHIEEVFSRNDEPAPEIEDAPAPVSAKEQSRRASVKQEQKDELEQEGVQEDGEETPAAEVTPDGEEQAPVQETTEEAAPLDANLRFAAEQFGWTADKIDKLYAADPELATTTFENLLNAFTNLSRQNSPAASPTPQGNPAAQQQAAVSRLDKLYADLKNFAAENGEPLADHFKAIHEEVIVPFRQMQAELAVQKQQAVRAEVGTVVNDLGKQFPAVYGVGDKATLVQQQARQQLYQMADQFRAGAQMQGKEMSVADALKRAHLVVTADQRVAEGRKQVQQQVQKRSKAITARPTQRRSPSAMGVSKGEYAAAEAYERRAHELGIEI